MTVAKRPRHTRASRRVKAIGIVSGIGVLLPGCLAFAPIPHLRVRGGGASTRSWASGGDQLPEEVPSLHASGRHRPATPPRSNLAAHGHGHGFDGGGDNADFLWAFLQPVRLTEDRGGPFDGLTLDGAVLLFVLQVAALAFTAASVVYLGLAAELGPRAALRLVEVDGAIAKDVIVKQLVDSYFPDDLKDAASIGASEVIGKTLVRLLLSPRALLLLSLPSAGELLRFLVRSSVETASEDAGSLLRVYLQEGAASARPVPFARRSYRRALVAVRRAGPVDAIAELIMWLVFAGLDVKLTGGFDLLEDLDKTPAVQALVVGALGGLSAELYRDLICSSGLAGPRRAKKLRRRTSQETGQAYFDAVSSASVLFFLYCEVIPSVVSAYFPDATGPDPIRDALQIMSSMYPRAWDAIVF